MEEQYKKVIQDKLKEIEKNNDILLELVKGEKKKMQFLVLWIESEVERTTRLYESEKDINSRIYYAGRLRELKRLIEKMAELKLIRIDRRMMN